MTSRVVSLALALMVAAGAAWYFWPGQGQQQGRAARGPVSVVTTEVRQQLLSDEVEALGTAQANEAVQLTASVSDRVARVHFQDGDTAQAGQLLVTLEHGEEEAEVTAAQVDLKEQQREYKRIQALVRNKTVPASELDRLQSAIDLARAELAQAEAKLADRFIRAPFAGVLGFRQVSPGSLVSQGTVVTTLDDLHRIKLDFQVPERYLGLLAPGKTIHAHSDAAGGSFEGVVSSIAPRVDPVSRSASIRAILDNADGRLRPGMLMTVRLVREARQALAVPEAAVFLIKEQSYVYVVNGDAQVEQRPVQTGLRLPGLVEITAGLDEGEQIITRGLLKVRPGAKVVTKAADIPGGEA
ncbi:efflux RND transporter periplasmic adaptor subunit [Gallaecimonas sp. GXIMD4217]|uniref:efflux RND transporter periplasmic adaptor subunit n=1 Tax=Gallaecimonas sp. GXIMD4217 TaxID=3131927 RepID=UPI00311B41C4